MSSLYIHIPFCKQACYYCDFHFSVNQNNKKLIVEAIKKEIVLQKNYLSNNRLRTIYFGGGTPSLLNEQELAGIFETIHHTFSVVPNAEITLEANPDDLTKEKLLLFKRQGINRLSIGTQSFQDACLQYLNRAHNATEAKQSILMAQDRGFDNISIDLIYAIPVANNKVWQEDLQQTVSLQVQHISAYCLTIEEKTVFGRQLQKQLINPINDEFASNQFNSLIAHLEQNQFTQYEISNFAKPGFYSQHNSNYWIKNPYLGIGPSAHSYNGSTRQFNIANNGKYLQALAKNTIPFEKEELSKANQVNEYIMTSLRTIWGCDLRKISHNFDINLLYENKSYIHEYIDKKLLKLEDDVLKLTNNGKLFADKIASDLFIIE
ncbi:radical SAM family heme chaperone HemW [Microscilla marina]|uniref:Heme chaperone HemW n=1 Tax=Microscilla marina ATCC 23134 TaxID=313606 RepID=A1ZTV2_MICM2|nr:radical SAM family heme chaperone HemW [Microscilla marina]EAY26205.1 putative oxygen-independent coproporphyrinogen III oxidase [Microscilla marina ATCC 23134]